MLYVPEAAFIPVKQAVKKFFCPACAKIIFRITADIHAQTKRVRGDFRVDKGSKKSHILVLNLNKS